MTRALNHPLSGLSLREAAAVEEAIASLAYWRDPKVEEREAKAKADMAPIDQMYAYFG